MKNLGRFTSIIGILALVHGRHARPGRSPAWGLAAARVAVWEPEVPTTGCTILRPWRPSPGKWKA